MDLIRRSHFATMSEWLELGPARSHSPVTGQLLSIVRLQIFFIPWWQHSVRFTNIREHCLPAVSLEKLPKSVRLTGNQWDLTGLGYIRNKIIYTTKIDEFVCPPNISETVAVRIMKLATSSTYCLDNDQTHVKTNFTVHFINFIKNN